MLAAAMLADGGEKVKQLVAAAAVIVAALIVAVVLVSRDSGEAPAPGDDKAEPATMPEGEAAGEAAPPQDGETASGEALPAFDIVRVETSGEAVMAGRAEQGARVTIMSRDGPLAEVLADEAGEWVAILEQPLAAGEHELWLEIENGDGAALQSAETVIVSVPEGEEGGEVLAVAVPRQGEGAARVLQEPAAGIGIASGGALTLESLSYGVGGSVILRGRAAPGAEILAHVNGAIAGRVTAGADGSWQLALEGLAAGTDYRLVLEQRGQDGSVAWRLETPLALASFAMLETSEPLVVIQPGNNLWLIARRIYGRGIAYTQIFEANRAQIADPDLIYPGQIFILPAAEAGG